MFKIVNDLAKVKNFFALCRLFFDLYRPQRSWGKVIFSQASVILSTEVGACSGGVCSRGGGVCCGGVCSGGDAWSGGLLARGGAWSRGVPGGDPPGTATAAGGTHPTGMHSCFHF